MGILDIPGASLATLGNSLRRQGWAIVANNPNALNGSLAVGAGTQQTYRSEHYAACNASSLRLVFGNWYGGASGGTPNLNSILVKASLERLSPLGGNTEDQPRIPVTFSAARYTTIDGFSVVISDPAAFRVLKGERFFVRTAITASVFGGAPAAPTLTPSTSGGLLPTGVQYQFALTYVFPAYETILGSYTQSAVTGAGSTNKITVTAPTAASGALGYRVWMSIAGANGTATLYSVSPCVPFGTNFDSLYVPQTSAPSKVNPTGYPTGLSLLGGTTFYSLDNGEGNNSVADIVDAGYAPIIAHQGVVSYSPIGILGNVAGKLPPSPVLIGDSIQAGKGDDGIGGATRGGAAYRALNGISTSTFPVPFVPNPAYGFMSAGPVPGETLGNFIDLTIGSPRRVASMLGSTVISDYGTNDLAFGSGLTMTRLIKLANLYTPAGVKLIQETFLPKTTSTDGWKTAANQTPNSDNAARVTLNTWLRSTATTGSVVTNEAAQHGTADGVAKLFGCASAFVIGTETVKVNGTPTSAYTYSNNATLPDGTLAAGEVSFNVAPSNGATITFSYTSVPGFKACAAPANSPLVDIYDVCAAVEVDSSGALTQNGGRWLPNNAAAIDSGTTTAVNTVGITDSTKAWTASSSSQNGYKGACVRITADGSIPASVGQVLCIAYNTATNVSSLTSVWGTNPSVGASYEIYRPYTIDGVHPSSDGYRVITAAIDLTKIV
jgi:hypothetical protein